MAKTQYLTYYIVLDDAALVAEYQAKQWIPAVNVPGTVPVGVVNRAPKGAAEEFGAPFRGYTNANEAPFTWTPQSGHGSDDGPYPLDVATFTRKSGGFLGIGGSTTKFYWLGEFVYAPSTATVGGVPAPPANIMKRRWIEGFEVGNGLGVAGGSVGNFQISQDASRHVGGMGMASRGPNSSTLSYTLAVFDPALVTAVSWERIYIRPRKWPTTGATAFWRCHGTSALAGASLWFTGSGELAVNNESASGVSSLLATAGAFTLREWRRLDLLIEYSAGTAGRLRVFVDGEPVLDLAPPGFNGQTRHVSSDIGHVSGTAGDLYIDLDDWINAELPGALTGADWLNGSKVALLRPQAFAGSHNGAAWAGDFRTLTQNTIHAATQNILSLVSTTSGAAMAVTTDSPLVVDAAIGKLPDGLAAMVVSLQGNRGTTSGSLGYQVGAGAPVLNAITQLGTRSFQATLYTVPGNSPDFPAAPTPIELLHTKGADVGSSSIHTLLAQVELVGVFGAEDFRETESGGLPLAFPGDVGDHNHPYPRTPWATMPLAAPSSPYIVQGGTYVGNGLGQDVTFRAPVHWFFVRPLTANTGGTLWWSTMIASHTSLGIGISPHVVDAREDPTFVAGAGEDAQQQRYMVRIAGNHAQANANGVTYQYVGICDPGGRFMLNDQLTARAADVTVVHPLINAAFTPEFGLLFTESYGALTNMGLYAKSSGLPASNVSIFTGSNLTNAFTFGNGEVTSGTAFHGIASAPLSVNLWRRSDGNNDPGEPKVVSFGSYVGDGTASRTLQVGTGGVRPLFAMVFSTAGVGYLRDPSHLATNSAQQGGSDGTTGITGGGIDQISVGSALNSNAVIYSYFILWGGTAAGNGGWSQNGEYIPVEADSPTDGWPDWPGEPVELPEEPANPDPGDLTTDIAANCIVASTRLCNQALEAAGVTQRITSLALDATQAGDTARLHYVTVLDAVLRAHPWDFATEYATLTKVGGSQTAPANRDWQFSYRAPADLVKARRLTLDDGRGRGYRDKPAPFRMGQDAVGELVFCALDSDDTPVILEYTRRVPCPAGSKDALFRQACMWSLAAAFATALSKDPKRADYCEQRYQWALNKAQTVDMREQQQSNEDGDAPWVSGR